MLHDQKIWVGTDTNHNPVYLLPHMSNRHGLIAGATGTGKTVTLKLIAEGFPEDTGRGLLCHGRAGVPFRYQG